MSRSSRAMAHFLPNILTFARIGLAGIFPLTSPSYWPTILILSAASDAFDGAFSRLFHASSTFGRTLDPIADKLFIGVVLLTLLAEGIVTVPDLLLVAARDLAVLSGVLLAVSLKGWRSVRHMPPRPLGKATTALQFLFLFWLVYTARSAPVPLLALTGAVSVLAGIDYLRQPHRSMPEDAARRVASDDATAELQHPQGDRRS
ncbi:CDP-alcohol phosphatidyltransferase family protein [Tautonia plasticadhaerens]|uniref:CDP-diacylglycerol--glycerol-3-phosphate 3-phosphatidyltransferase n=1 Tax=Tautonia plasticadhaerens TaxID=2527974 RepID=A0A518H8G0_9BACT|nr:CDP-alcohol phosphatidyltransferase family protein [Tautonia plasticadhaerens]QDV37056.1 CDP-diacylglycerol--glycerol-3-phosphate 3-phosphatidyltransferase [Tautonia plasticadhaerens]